MLRHVFAVGLVLGITCGAASGQTTTAASNDIRISINKQIPSNATVTIQLLDANDRPISDEFSIALEPLTVDKPTQRDIDAHRASVAGKIASVVQHRRGFTDLFNRATTSQPCIGPIGGPDNRPTKVYTVVQIRSTAGKAVKLKYTLKNTEDAITITAPAGRSRVAETVAAAEGTPTCSCSPEGGQTCRFDTDGDGAADLVLSDSDGNGVCEVPIRKTHLHGTLRIGSCDAIEVVGSTVLEADRIVVEPFGTFTSGAAGLRALTLMSLAGEVESAGDFTLDATDDVVIRSRGGGIALGGSTAITAGDQLTVDARQGDLVLRRAGEGAGAGLATAANAVALSARGSSGRVVLDGTVVAGRRVTLDGTTNTLPSGPKGIVLTNRSLVSTDGSIAPLSGSPGNVTLRAASEVASFGGTLRIDGGSRIASGRGVLVSTVQPGDACLSGGATLSAAGGVGIVNLTPVHGDVLLSDGASIVGDIVGAGRLVAGQCGPPSP